MPNTSQSSFIPKNNLPNRQKVGRRYNFFFISLVVYGLFIATPIASAVVFIYEKHTKNVINKTTLNLDNAIKSFSESDLLTVQQFDQRLLASSEVLANSVPLNSLLQFFLQNAPRTVSFTGIEIESVDDKMMTINAEVASESFDYVLFYRDELLRNPTFTSSEISEVSYKGSDKEESNTNDSNDKSVEQTSKLTYRVMFTVPISFFTDQTNSINSTDSANPESIEEIDFTESMQPAIESMEPLELLPDNTNNQ